VSLSCATADEAANNKELAKQIEHTTRFMMLAFLLCGDDVAKVDDHRQATAGIRWP